MTKLFEYKPTGDFKGTVNIEVPNYKERIALAQGVGLSSQLSETEMLGKASELYDLAEKYTKTIKVRHKDTKEEFNSLEELSYSREGSELVNEIAQVVLNGIPLGNK